MRKIIAPFIVLLIILSMPNLVAASWLWSKPLVEIDQTPYSTEDYAKWWQYWQDEGQVLPVDPDSFINWQLMVREAETMELDSSAEFKRKIEVFLKARTLMLLKYDEVDAKINITEDDLQDIYNRDYSPRRLIAALYFTNQKDAASFYDSHLGKKMDFEDLQQLAKDENENNFKLNPPQWLRPVTTPKNWLAVVGHIKSGEFASPIIMGEGMAILYIVDLKNGDQQDFEKKKKSIKSSTRRTSEKKMTQSLLERLRKKYKLVIDQDLLAETDLNTTDPQILAKTLISSTKSTVTIAYFIEQCKREMKINKGSFGDKAQQEDVKKRVLSAMISNGLVSWASLDRQYETKEPFKSQFQFYRQNRLVKELKNRIVGGGSSSPIGEKMAREYYQKNIADFQTPAMARLILVKDSPDIIQNIWAQVISKQELIEAAKKNDARIAYTSEAMMPLSQLSKQDLKVVSQLQAGEVSAPYIDGAEKAIVQLVEMKPSANVPFKHVKKPIIARMNKERRDELISEYMLKLRQNAEISINQTVWKETVKTLSNE